MDLTASELSMAIDRERRAVTSLELVVRRPDEAGVLPLPFVTNTTTHARRQVLVYVDEDSLNPGEETHVQAAITRVVEALDVDDRVGLASIRLQRAGVTLTADRQRLQTAIEGLVGLRRASSDRCTFPEVYGQVMTLFANLPTDAPTTVVLFSGGTYQCDARNSGGTGSNPGGRTGAVDFYVVHVVSPSGETGDPASLERLARSADATFLRMAAGRPEAVAAIASISPAYYVAHVAVPGSMRDDVPRRISVTTSRERVRLNAPHAIRLAATAAAAPGVTAVSEAVRSPGEWRDLGLRARSLVSPIPGESRIRLVTMFHSPSETDLSAAIVGVFDLNGSTVAQWSARASELGRPLTLAALPIPPGQYRVRVAAASADGRIGAVDQTIDARVVEPSGLAASGLMLGVLNQGSLSPVLDFTDEPMATVYLELTGVASGAETTVRLELRTADGQPSAEPLFATVRPGAEPSHRVVHGEVHIASLPAGDYLVRATVFADGTLVATRSGTLRKIAGSVAAM